MRKTAKKAKIMTSVHGVPAFPGKERSCPRKGAKHKGQAWINPSHAFFGDLDDLARTTFTVRLLPDSRSSWSGFAAGGQWQQ